MINVNIDFGYTKYEVIFIKRDIKIAEMMNDFLKILDNGSKSFEVILERLNKEEQIKVCNELILSLYKHNEKLSSIISEAGVEKNKRDTGDKISLLIDEGRLAFVKGDYAIILFAIDLINKMIRKIYEFLYVSSEDTSRYNDEIEKTLFDLELYRIKFKDMLNLYF